MAAIWLPVNPCSRSHPATARFAAAFMRHFGDNGEHGPKPMAAHADVM
jgi:hypothetical protein